MRKILFILAVVLLMVACTEEKAIKYEKVTNTGDVEKSYMIPVEGDEGENEVAVVVEGQNKEEVKLVKVIQSRNVNNFLELVLVVQNSNSVRENMMYKVLFFDEYGKPFENLAGWKSVQIEPDDTAYEKVTAKEAGAKTYKINLKYMD